ncbi:hypothetical protein CJU89_6218 [Yarrowia sp. B02]|nr:hypothetical protein CJU89_6218 [Yarrowia sp. B02]
MEASDLTKARPWVPISATDESFQFFARLTITDGGYTLHLADVASFEFWVESLSKDRVTIRAEDDDCLIDANDPKQHVVLLEKLDQALREGSIDIRKTSRGMRLSVALKMESGTLEWTFRVAQITEASELVSLQRSFFSGLVTVNHSLLSQVHHLESQLSLKDYHIGAMQKQLADTEPGRSTEYRPRRFVEAAYKTDPEKLIESWKKERPAATEREAMMSLGKVDPSLWTLKEAEKEEEVEVKPETSFADDFMDDPMGEVPSEPVVEKTETSVASEPPQPDLNSPDQCETEDEDEDDNEPAKADVTENKNETKTKEDTPASASPLETTLKTTPEKPKPANSMDPFGSQLDSQGSPKRRIGSLLKNTPSSPVKGDEEQDSTTETLKRKQLEQSLQKQRSAVKKKRRF